VSDVTVSNVLDSDHLSIIFHVLDHVKIRNLWNLPKIHRLGLASKPCLEINSGVEADKAACNFTGSVVSTYRLATSKVTLLDINNNLGLDWLLKYKRGLRKLWQETIDPACKTSVNWVTKSIRQMTHK
jgi:hypothetical protein